MASDPVETFLGWTGLGFGVLLAYGAYKNVPILGPKGLLTQALTTGKIPGSPPKKGATGKPNPSAGWPGGTGGGDFSTPVTPTNGGGTW